MLGLGAQAEANLEIEEKLGKRWIRNVEKNTHNLTWKKPSKEVKKTHDDEH